MELQELVKNELVPALGCTEPISIALSCAKAREVLSVSPDSIDKVIVEVDRNVFKNGFAVGIPGTNFSGNEFAAALGIVAGNPAGGLEVLSDIKEKDIARARELVEQGRINIELNKEARGLYVVANVYAKTRKAVVVVKIIIPTLLRLLLTEG